MRIDKLASVLIIIILVTSIFISVVPSSGDLKGAGQIDEAGPYAPDGPIPEDGETGLNTSLTLSVYVSHPEDLSMDVSFYDDSTDSLIGTDTEVASGELASVHWDGLDPDSDYQWYAVADDGVETETGGPWSFSTADVDYVRITDKPDGEVLGGGDVPPGHTEWGYLSAYNRSSGYVGNFQGGWEVSGDAELLNMEWSDRNGIEMGDTAGDVWLNVTYEGDHQHSVKYTILTDEIDQIQITRSPGGEILNDETVPVGARRSGYSSAFNETHGYLYTFEGGWSAEGSDAELLEETPNERNEIDVGHEGGYVWFNLTYEDLHDSVMFEVEDPEIDSIDIMDEPGGEGDPFKDRSIEIGETVELFASAHNDTSGFVEDIEVDWDIDQEEVGDIEYETGSNTTFKAGSEGVCNITASYDGFEESIQFTVYYDGSPEIRGTIPDIELEIDFGIHEIDLEEFAEDGYDEIGDMRWYLTGHDIGVIEVLGENQTGDHVLTILSEENTRASMNVTYHLVNSVGNEASQNAWINITSDHQSPEFRRCPDLKVHYDKPYDFDYSPYIIYDDDRKHELELETDDPEHTSVEGLTVTYEYPESMIDEEVLVVLSVSDGDSTEKTAITVEVTSNDPPEEVEELPDLEIEQGELKENVFDLDDYFMDPEDEPLYMSYGYTYLSITIHGDNTVDVEADVDWHGVERVTFRAEDPEGAIIEQTIEVTVLPVNFPPEIKELPDLVVHYEEPYVFDLQYYISDRDNETHELTISTDSPDNATVRGTELILEYPMGTGDRYPNYTVALEVFVSDGLETTSQVTTVKVGDHYPPELVIPLHDVAFKQNERLINAFDLDNHFMDREGYNMYYSSGNENIEVVIHDNSSVDFYAKDNWYGQELITIRAENSAGALMEDSLVVTVLPVNTPPEISELPLQEGTEGRSWIFDIADYISDVDNETHELEVDVEDPNVHVVGHKLIFDYDEPGSYTILVEVCDGLESTTEEMEVRVNPEEEEHFLFDNLSSFVMVLLPLTLALIGTGFYVKRKVFTIDDVFLIHDSGVLIKHKTKNLKAERDEEILAGMFTAVNNFVGDAFGGEEKDTLKRMEYGDDKVLVHKGKNVILAVFISGDEPSWILDSMSDLVADIEERYEGDIEDWDGDVDSLPGIGDMLDEMIESDGKYNRGDWEG